MAEVPYPLYVCRFLFPPANTEKLYHGRELISYPSNPKDITVYEDHELEWLLKDQFVPYILNTAYKLENGYEIY